MTRRIVYGISLWAFLGASACTIAAIALPNWVSYSSPATIPNSDPIRVTYGLHKRCSSITGRCTHFPQNDECHGSEDRYFCNMWRTTGFLMNFVIVMELACLVGYLVILSGGRGAREVGWKVLAGLLSIVTAGELTAMALVAYLYDHDNRFFVGWALDKSWVLCTVSWCLLFLNILGVIGGAKLVPKEDDYEPIPDVQ
ncbi:hypothetical protein K431DRAFT_259071 [Polychaeton citri CBS 116435]|uniref:Uncharacterized protein n=1 Tax=Polychaeton citri CBS 116435 TaxID=1314669 RepID=A0A9P4UUX3_9PEZI|nr:hypothetical protein K431DRAFT_259071 [Polychaeton citri CBS 116435]